LQFRDSKNPDLYNQLVPADLAEKVYQENDVLVETIAEAEYSEMAKEIMNLYNQRIEKVQAFIDKEKGANLEYASSITQFFVKAGKNPVDHSNIGRWFLLDMCYKEKSGNNEGLSSLPDDDRLLLKLTSGFSNSKNAPTSARLNDDDAAYFIQKMSDYKNKKKNRFYRLRNFVRHSGRRV